MADNVNISPDMIENLVNMLKNNDNMSSDGSSDSRDSESHSNIEGIDFNTILKIKSIMESLNNENDKNSNLLYSLKPYLRKSRQSKIDQYINILKISQISKLLSNTGDDK